MKGREKTRNNMYKSTEHTYHTYHTYSHILHIQKPLGTDWKASTLLGQNKYG